jgi:hypothetical protein
MTMRLTTMSRLAAGVRADDQPELSANLQEQLEPAETFFTMPEGTG